LTIKCDVPLPMKVAELALRPRDPAKLAVLFERFGFKSWRQELDAPAETVPPTTAVAESTQAVLVPRAPRNYEMVTTSGQLEAWLDRLRKAEIVSFDTETTSLDGMAAELVGMSFSVEAGAAAYVPLGHRYAGAPAQLERDAVLKQLKPWLEDA